jgi:hypothetical protein
VKKVQGRGRQHAIITIEVPGAKAGHIEACVIDEMPAVQGLLGESFLSASSLDSILRRVFSSARPGRSADADADK